MNRLRTLLLALSLITGPAFAHQDRILTLEPDGWVPEIPSSFGRTALVVEGLGTAAPLVRLNIGTHTTTLPVCMTKWIRTKERSDIKLTGSWHHDETRLPYYINVTFFDPEHDPEKSHNASQEFAFSLRDAKLLESPRPAVNRIAVARNLDGMGGKHVVRDGPWDCHPPTD